MADPRFIPHIQLREYEAYLFAAPDCFGYFYDGSEKGIAELKAIAKSCDTPELIDDGANTAPSKRIVAHFRDYKSAKATLGPQIAERIGLPRIRDKRPHFHAWLSRLERLDSAP